jgi:hypothetical protein
MDASLDLRTPCCNRAVRGTPAMVHATTVLDRTCPRCHTHYRVVIQPGQALRLLPRAAGQRPRFGPTTSRPDLQTHTVTWAPTRSASLARSSITERTTP